MSISVDWKATQGTKKVLEEKTDILVNFQSLPTIVDDVVPIVLNSIMKTITDRYFSHNYINMDPEQDKICHDVSWKMNMSE